MKNIAFINAKDVDELPIVVVDAKRNTGKCSIDLIVIARFVLFNYI